MICNGWNKPAKQGFVEMGKDGGFTQGEGNEGNFVGQRGEQPTLQHAILVRVEEGESAAEDRPAQKQKTDPEVGCFRFGGEGGMIRHCVAHPFGAAVGRSSQLAALLEPSEGAHPPSSTSALQFPQKQKTDPEVGFLNLAVRETA